MFLKPWVLASIAAIVLWGIAAFFRKKAIAFVPPQSALTFEVLGAVIALVAILALTGGQVIREPRGAMFGVFTGIFAVTGTLFVFRALKDGEVSLVSAFTAVAILIPVLLGVFLLHEKLLPHHVLGIIMGIAAAILLSF